MTTNPIFALHCTYDFAPGYAWSAELKFKPHKKGFTITGFLSTDDENAIQRIVGKSAQEPTWRNVAAWLKTQEEVGLAGDVLHSIKFDAAVPWQGEMLAAWIYHERPEPACDFHWKALTASFTKWLFRPTQSRARSLTRSSNRRMWKLTRSLSGPPHRISELAVNVRIIARKLALLVLTGPNVIAQDKPRETQL